MLQIVCVLLKIIGFGLLAIAGLLVLAACAILLVPLRYQGHANVCQTVESVKARLTFSWFFHLLSGYVSFEEKELRWQTRFFWKKIPRTQPKPPETETGQDKGKPNEHRSEKRAGKKGKKDEKKAGAKSGAEAKSFPGLSTIRTFLEDETHLLAWKRLWQELIRLFRFLRPKKLTVDLHFGFEDPSVTGKVLGAFAILYPFYMDHIRLRPEFDKKILEGSVLVKGNLRGLRLLIVLCSLLSDKNIKTTYKEIVNRKN